MPAQKECHDELRDAVGCLDQYSAVARSPRVTEPGLDRHVLNRRVIWLALFHKEHDYLVVEPGLAESLQRRDGPGFLVSCLIPDDRHGML